MRTDARYELLVTNYKLQVMSYELQVYLVLNP